MAEIRHTFRARLDLLEIFEYVGARNRLGANRLFERLEARIKILERFPRAGRARPEIAPDARVLVEAPYLILYRLVAGDVQIVRVVHGARRITAALFDAGRPGGSWNPAI